MNSLKFSYLNEDERFILFIIKIKRWKEINAKNRRDIIITCIRQILVNELHKIHFKLDFNKSFPDTYWCVTLKLIILIDCYIHQYKWIFEINLLRGHKCVKSPIKMIDCKQNSLILLINFKCMKVIYISNIYLFKKYK